MEMFYAVVSFLTGIVVGSFLNVVIYRLPRGENLSKPRSHCPGCGKLIVWYDNIPLLSWLLLRARCRGCHQPIAFRYPLVELLTGVLFLLAWANSPADLVSAAIVALFLAALLAISFIDIDLRIIPDAISLKGMVFFVALAPLYVLHTDAPPLLQGVKPAMNAWLHAGLGLVVGAGVVYLIRVVGTWIMKKEAMGFGDVKLLGFIGAAVGPLFALYALALACLGGAVIGGLMLIIRKSRPKPCILKLSGDDVDITFTGVRMRGTNLEVRGAPPLSVGREVDMSLELPATSILADENAHLERKVRVLETSGEGASRRLVLEALEPSDIKAEDLDIEREDLEMFRNSHRYIPFGPFLALGGALTALYGPQVHWFMTEGYPEFARSLFR